jgi:predicted  nucleic acid-binding Zn-ribbon protein
MAATTKKSTVDQPSVQSGTQSGTEIAELRAEVARLRELLGPSEESYVKLRLDVLGARDAAIGAEAEAGRLKGYCKALEAQVARLDRDQIWFRQQVVMRMKNLRHSSPTLGKVVSRLSK